MSEGTYLVDGPVRVQFVQLGEGLYGDYDPTDPTDVELLRIDCNVSTASEYGGEDTDDPAWQYPQDGSSCTNIPVSTTPEDQQRLLAYAATRLRIAVETDSSVKHAMGELSYLSDVSDMEGGEKT